MKTTPEHSLDMPALPDGFKFINRGLPCYTNDELGMAIYIDHINPTQREHEKRFVVQYIPADDLMTDDWEVVLTQIKKAEVELRDWNAEKHIWKEADEE
jgi:hypothetical protein